MFILSSKSFLPIFLLLTSLFSPISTFAENVLIAEICKQATNPSLCSKTLTSDPRSPTADLQTLGHIAIEKSHASANSTRDLIKSLGEPIASPRIKDIYDNCLTAYSDALRSLDSCTKNLVSKDFKMLDFNAWSVIMDAMSCDAGFEGGAIQEPVQEPPTLVQASQELNDLANVISVITEKLTGANNF